MAEATPHPAPGRVPERLLRVGDEERERAASALAEHYGAGRLEREELDARLDAAYHARTRADLDRLLADLPGRERRTPRRLPGPLWLLPVVVVLVAVAAAAVGSGHPPFPLVPLVWLLFATRARRWRHPTQRA